MPKHASKVLIPPELRRKVSQSLLMFTGLQGIFMRVMCVGVAAFGLSVASSNNGLWIMAGACICPSAVAVFYMSFPLRPYRGNFYAKDMHDVDVSDPVVMRLVELLKSTEARRHLWSQAVKLSGILFVITWAEAIFFWGSVNWSFSFPSSRFWGFLVFCFILCFAGLSVDHTNWGLNTWARRETEHQPA